MRREEEHRKAEEERARAWEAREKKRLEEEEDERWRQLQEEQAHAVARDQARKLAIARDSQLVSVCNSYVCARVLSHARITFSSVFSFYVCVVFHVNLCCAVTHMV